MDNEKLEKAIEEMLQLYNQNKLKELAAIRDGKEESDERKIAAHTVLQMGVDLRK